MKNFRRLMTLGVALLGITILMLSSAPQANANPIVIDFSTGLAGNGGTVSFAGGSSALVGTGIRIGAVTSINTPSNEGTYTVTGSSGYGILTFTSGAFQSYSGGVYTFGPGGSFTITGGVPDAGIVNGTALLTGTFSSATVNSAGSLSVFWGYGNDKKNADLLAFFGLPAGVDFQFSGFSINLGQLPTNGGAFTSTAFSTDIANTAVPEPGSLLLLGSGVLLIYGISRKFNG